MKIFILFTDQNQYIAIDPKGEIVQRGIAEQLPESDVLSQAKSIIGILPGELVTIKRLDLPIRQQNKLLKALPFALENDVLGDIDDQHLTLVSWGNNKPVYVSICANSTIEKYLEWAKEYNIKLDSLIPDFAVFNVDSAIHYHFISRDDNSTILIEENYLRSICDNDFIKHAARSLVSNEEEFEVRQVSVNSEEIAYYLKDIPGLEYVTPESAPSGMEQALVSYINEKSSPYELLTDEYAPPSAGFAKYSLAIGGGLLGFVLLSKVAFDHWLSFNLNSEITDLTNKAQSAVAEVFPNMRRFSSLSTLNFQIDQELAKMQGNEGVSNEFMYLLQQLTAGLQRSNANLEQLSYRNNALVFNATVGQFSQLQNVENALKTSGDLDVKLISSGNQGNEVNARYEIRLK